MTVPLAIRDFCQRSRTVSDSTRGPSFSAPPSSRRCAHEIYGAPRGGASVAVGPPERRSFRAGRVLSLSRRNFRATTEREKLELPLGGKLVVHGGRAKMPPKKREKDLDGQKGPRMDQIQADHELFLQAFESK